MTSCRIHYLARLLSVLLAVSLFVNRIVQSSFKSLARHGKLPGHDMDFPANYHIRRLDAHRSQLPFFSNQKELNISSINVSGMVVLSNHLTTKSLSRQVTILRAEVFLSIMGCFTLLLVVFATYATVKKTGKLEVPTLIWQGCCKVPGVGSYDLLTLCKGSACFGGNYEKLPNDELESAEVEVRDAEQPPSQSDQPTDQPTDELSLGPWGTTAARKKKAEEEKPGESQSQQEISPEKRAEVEQAFKAKGEQWQRMRFFVQCLLFLVYVAICSIIPLMYRDSVSCSGGFFWEQHMPFFSAFMVTKFAELAFYLHDLSIGGQLPMWKFMMVFLASFLGFSDGYQDATSIQIARACSLDAEAPVDHDLAKTLSTTMAYSFWVGVFGFQWVVLGFYAIFRDRSSACLARLIHMDALSLCINIEDDNDMKAWIAVSLVRTVGEDIPQAIQQILFVTHVKRNLFMIVSICFSVACSVKAVLDAIKRTSEAVGFDEYLKRVVAEEGGEAADTKTKKASSIYVIGGMQGGTNPLDSLQIMDYDLPEDQRIWQQGPPMSEKRGLMGAAVHEGKIYVFGGSPHYYNRTALATVEVFDLISRAWSQSTPMPKARYMHQVACCNDKIYIVGGCFDKSTTATEEVDVFDPRTQQWEAGPPLPELRCRFGIAVDDGCIIVVGGTTAHPAPNYNRNVWLLDTRKTPLLWEVMQSMPTGRESLSVAAMDGFLGAVCGSKPGSEGTTDFEVFDIKSNSWSTGPPVLSAREHCGAASIGGSSEGSSATLVLVGGTSAGRYSGGVGFETLLFQNSEWTSGPRLEKAVWDPAVVAA